MKTSIKFLSALIVFVIGVKTSAQTHDHSNMNMAASKTVTFKVWGNCAESCKTRIEKAVKDDGASSAEWNLKTQILTVTFDPEKTNIDSMSKKLAAAGHDTEKYKADDKIYNSLDACCKYRKVKQE